MRSRLSTLMLTLVASALVASLASATPTIRFAQGPKRPPECTINGINLDCVATAGTPLNFGLIVLIGAEATASGSFSAQWDGQLQNSLGSASATVGAQTYITVDPGPPPVNVSYIPAFGGPGVVDSTGASAGSAQSWSWFGGPDYPTNIQTAGHSWRAGSLTVTVDEEIETFVDLGFFQGGGFDVFIAADGSQVTPLFGLATINAPEPTAALGLLAGLGSVALLARRSRRS